VADIGIGRDKISAIGAGVAGRKNASRVDRRAGYMYSGGIDVHTSFSDIGRSVAHHQAPIGFRDRLTHAPPLSAAPNER